MPASEIRKRFPAKLLNRVSNFVSEAGIANIGKQL